jgi:hypothetical protein
VPVVVHNTSKPRHGADRNQGAVPCTKRHSFLSFPYVCPEPVLVK